MDDLPIVQLFHRLRRLQDKRLRMPRALGLEDIEKPLIIHRYVKSLHVGDDIGLSGLKLQAKDTIDLSRLIQIIQLAHDIDRLLHVIFHQLDFGDEQVVIDKDVMNRAKGAAPYLLRLLEFSELDLRGTLGVQLGLKIVAVGLEEL